MKNTCRYARVLRILTKLIASINEFSLRNILRTISKQSYGHIELLDIDTLKINTKLYFRNIVDIKRIMR